jgi:hypothetical protein
MLVLFSLLGQIYYKIYVPSFFCFKNKIEWMIYFPLEIPKQNQFL